MISVLTESEEGVPMFNIVNANGYVLTVYAVSGSLFLIWNDSAADANWEWVPMEPYRPLGHAEGIK